MKREQQQAQVQMALQLLQMLREGRNQSERNQLMREQMQNEMQMGKRKARMGKKMKQQEWSQQEKIANADRAQQLEIAKMNQLASQQQQVTRNQGMMDPQILDYLQNTMTIPDAATREVLLSNLEQLTGKTYQRPVDQFQQLLNPKK